MKKIGYDVSMLAPGENNPRNGEGTFLRLRDGGILYAYSRYIGASWDDHADADIAGIVSYDEGETWSERKILFEKPLDSKNIMSFSFLRMNNGDIGAFFIIKNLDGTDQIVLTRSADEGETWSKPVKTSSCEKFISRGGRIPAPIHSLKN